jgi:glyoxalase family protein
MQLTGIHHLTAVSADASGNVSFYTKVLGMRLVKKIVNQDDVSAYHLFYADGNAWRAAVVAAVFGKTAQGD